MRCIDISDMTLKYAGDRENGIQLSFREKIEIAKLLDRMNVSAIELAPIRNDRADSLLIKSIAMCVKNSVVAAPVLQDMQSIEPLWNALKEARHPRIQLEVPVSDVQMEYFWHRKKENMLPEIRKRVHKCRELCADVELLALDATRCETDFLCDVIRAAVESGAGKVTVCDSAGLMLPDEMSSLFSLIREKLGDLNVSLGIRCADTLSMADACSLAAVRSGADDIKVISCTGKVTAVRNIMSILRSRGDSLELSGRVRAAELGRLTGMINHMCLPGRDEGAVRNPAADQEDELMLSSHDSRETVLSFVEEMGYVLSEEDAVKVYDSFMRIAEKKETVTRTELDTIIAAVAMQVPPTYKLINYVISSSNALSASAHIVIEKDGRNLEAVTLGDGPIDASFHAIEQIAGRHFELDDFTIRAVTEGREAMGETVVRLRSEGRVCSGRGISTDIVDSAIRAYLNALNKIVYEEAEA